MFATATALLVDRAVRQQLESLVRSGSTPQRIAQKCRIILMAGDGVSNRSIAQQLNLSRPTVIATRDAFVHGGVEALTGKCKRKRSGLVFAPTVENKMYERQLKAMT